MVEDRYRPLWITDEVAMFREATSRFFATEFAPRLGAYRDAGCIARDMWRKAGAAGIIAASLPEEYGGGNSRAFMAMVLLEQGRAGDAAWGIGVQNYICHYILHYGTPEQRARWLPKLASGEWIAAIAMTEPAAGSDLKMLATTARRERDEYVIDGRKTFITNGQTADLVCVAAKTDPRGGAKGVSLIVVETADTPGFSRGPPLKKIGLHAADTSELFFDGLRVPAADLLGGVEGHGFEQLMSQLPWERLSLAIRAVGMAEYALDETLRYTRERKMFGSTLFALQNTQFKLAEAKTKVEAMRGFVFSCIERLLKGELDVATAAMAKLFCSQAVNEIVDECLQLHGGYGFMEEYPIGRLYGDVRAQKIYGGANEVMKLLIARHLG